MKKISMIFKDDKNADDWLKALKLRLPIILMMQTRIATIKVSKRKRKAKAV